MTKIITDLGKVMPISRGDWNDTSTYRKLDFVLYNNNTYIGITTTIEPGILPTNTDYWRIFAIQGEKGDKGDKGDTGLTGPTGPTGNMYYTTFEVDFTNGILYAVYDENYEGPIFDIDEKGFLGVTI